MNLSELSKSPRWRSLPTEVAHLIAEMTGRFKLRDGVLVPQIPSDDPRRQMLTTIPRILQSSRQEGADEIFVSTVESTRPPNNITHYVGDTPATFKICSETRNPDRGYWRYVEFYEDEHWRYEESRLHIYNICREVVFSFGMNKTPCFGRNVDQVIVERNGKATRVEAN